MQYQVGNKDSAFDFITRKNKQIRYDLNSLFNDIVIVFSLQLLHQLSRKLQKTKTDSQAFVHYIVLRKYELNLALN